ncbi:27862_t:CDS:2 [Dentiscutata erythropus]|uniref:27862_t:CDS:1 n=1 Tax=Dentiscutata erythropus TaxID=1348616 RepID=A0A9N8ZU66_9GLOM|nr:27862_t:CDS:2 [Dentiscutata erythropus]
MSIAKSSGNQQGLIRQMVQQNLHHCKNNFVRHIKLVNKVKIGIVVYLIIINCSHPIYPTFNRIRNGTMNIENLAKLEVKFQ